MSDEVVEWLRSNGLNFDPVLNGKVQRYVPEGRKDARGWYVGAATIVKGNMIYSITVGDWETDKHIYFRTGGFSNGDLDEYKKTVKERSKEVENEKERMHEDAAKKAAEIWEKSSAAGESEYLKNKKIDGVETGIRFHEGKIVVPLRDSSGALTGLQFISKDGEKRFLPGTKKKGCFFVIPNRGCMDRYVCEGFATAVSVSLATKAEVYVAFDAGNLKSVAGAIRDKSKSENEDAHRIIIAADNDQGREHGKNIGVEKATEAAAWVNGKVVIPFFQEQFETGKNPSDWNDIHCIYGIEEVGRQIEEQTKNIGKEVDRSMPGNDSDHERLTETESGSGGKEAQAAYGIEQAVDDVWDKDAIKYLGFIDGKHSYISKHSKKIVPLSPSQHTELNLLELMPYRYWDTKYSNVVITEKGPKKLAIKWNMAADELITKSLNSGYFEPGRIRGAGVFKDGKSVVINTGSQLIVDGESVSHSVYESKYIYIPGPKISFADVEPASHDDCLSLLDVGHAILWQKDNEAKFFLGWLVCAILSGALKWRPHLYITGAPGVGKSWLLENLVHPLIRQFSEYFLSNSSEAGIRQSIKNNALAVIWDEPEVNNESDNRVIQKVLALARQSSFESDGRVSRGTSSGSAMEFSIKACFLLGSIKDAVQEGADLTRFTILGLTKISDPCEAQSHFKRLEKIAYELTDGDFPKRFAKMVCLRMRDFEQNNEMLKNIITRQFNSRVAQQYAALLSGYCIIAYEKPVTEDVAIELVTLITGQENVHHDPSEDIREVFDYLTAKMVVVDAAEDKSGSVRMSIGEIMGKDALSDRLESYGMRVVSRDDAKYLFVCHRHPELKNIFRDSKWVSGWVRSLSKMDGTRSAAQRISGTLRRGIEIPI